MSDFNQGSWVEAIDVRDFVQRNYTDYTGDASFLAGPTERTNQIWQQLLELMKEEQAKGILDLDTETPSSIVSHQPGYINKDQEVIVGLQTDKPLKRSIKPFGGVRLVQKAAESFGYQLKPELIKIFEEYRKTHNDGVFSIYTPEYRLLRSKHIVTGLPDSYGRGRIIGDYRRLALYGTDKLIAERKQYLEQMNTEMDSENMQLRDEIFEQLKALEQIQQMAAGYGFDVSKPATDSKEAIQWVYFAYLAAVKQQDGAAMSLGRVDAFLDIYFERDLQAGKYTEEQIQELVDDFVIKLRIVRHLRPPEYDQLFAGDPTWVTLVLGGTGLDGRNLVTKTSFRFLHTLTNLGPAPEPNLTVLWGKTLPETWKRYCAQQSIDSSSIQYINDDMLKTYYGDDYGIACCVSGMAIGKDMQFFGARANIAKALLLAINAGKSEPLTHDISIENDKGMVIVPEFAPLTHRDYLDYDEVWAKYKLMLDWLAERYVKIMNIIHYSHDRYSYESSEMALHDEQVRRFMAFGAAGLSVVTDSLSAIKYAKVKPIWNEYGVAERYEIEGEYPQYGNDDDRVDQIAVEVVKTFMNYIRKYKTYRDSIATLSILTITSNVVYGKATGATPDGRGSGEPFAPGANPMHGRDHNGAIASLNSVAKIPYSYAQDGVSNTFSIVPTSLGQDREGQISNLVTILNGYLLEKGAQHLNINVLNRETLLDAQLHPEKYPQLTIRVSGYAVNFIRLSAEQQREVIARTFHERL